MEIEGDGTAHIDEDALAARARMAGERLAAEMRDIRLSTKNHGPFYLSVEKGANIACL
jgi:hypothetical protein